APATFWAIPLSGTAASAKNDVVGRVGLTEAKPHVQIIPSKNHFQAATGKWRSKRSGHEQNHDCLIPGGACPPRMQEHRCDPDSRASCPGAAAEGTSRNHCPDQS